MTALIPSIRYSLNVISIPGHLFEVTMSFDPQPNHQHILSLPSWIPGSYMVRDFAKNIIKLSVNDEKGRIIKASKVDKQTWQLEPANGQVTVTYQVYAFDLSIRSAYICDEYAFLNGTSLFLQLDGRNDTPCKVDIQKPAIKGTESWRVATSLSCEPKTVWGYGEYSSDNYLDLIDHPILIGEFDDIPFEAADTEFSLVLAGGHIADTARITSDLEKICAHHVKFFQSPSPVSRYLFITLLCDSGFGGLEHISSTALLYPRFDLPRLDQANDMPDGYRTFLSLCSHEFFHTWLVKRMKPEVLLTPDLAKENYTEQLWIYEGFTSYYDDLTLLRTGLISTESYLELLGQQISRLEINTGRQKQSITESSFDAWTRFYQQDASAVNNIVSYYNKGAVLAFCLDSLMQKQSDGKHSLNDLLREMWRNYQTNHLTHNNSVQDIVSDIFALNLEAFFDSALYSCDELPLKECLGYFGLEFNHRTMSNDSDKGGKSASNTSRHQFGASYKSTELGVKVLRVREETPAYDAGIQVGDRLIAIDQWQITNDNIQTLINNAELDTEVLISLLRDGKFKQINLPIRTAPKDSIYLTVADDVAVKQWIGRD